MIIPEFIASMGRMPGWGQALRYFAGRYREGSVVKIRHGHAAGLWWQRHHRYVNGYWIGHYELPVQEALRRELKQGDTFFDIGANAGFFTLIGARLVGPGGRCIAFEPLEDNCASIEEQIQANALGQCVVAHEAISDFVGWEDFSFSPAGLAGAHLGESRYGERQQPVKVVTLDGACLCFGQPDFIKMDIEGAEARALKGSFHTLHYLRPKWLIELHGFDSEREVKRLLREADYIFTDLRGLPLNPNEVLPDHFSASFPGDKP